EVRGQIFVAPFGGIEVEMRVRMIADQVPGLIPLPQGCFALRRITLMPQTNRQILRFHFSRVSKMARLASRQEMLRLTEVVGSSAATLVTQKPLIALTFARRGGLGMTKSGDTAYRAEATGEPTGAPTGVSQLWRSGLAPDRIAKNSSCRRLVTGPRRPMPTVMRSTERNGVISAAVPVKKTSSAMYSISRSEERRVGK